MIGLVFIQQKINQMTAYKTAYAGYQNTLFRQNLLLKVQIRRLKLVRRKRDLAIGGKLEKTTNKKPKKSSICSCLISSGGSMN